MTFIKMPNMEPVPGTPNMFVLRTQAGFRAALKSLGFGDQEVGSYPTKYPCMATIVSEYSGYHRVETYSAPLDQVGALWRRHTRQTENSERQRAVVNEMMAAPWWGVLRHTEGDPDPRTATKRGLALVIHQGPDKISARLVTPIGMFKMLEIVADCWDIQVVQDRAPRIIDMGVRPLFTTPCGRGHILEVSQFWTHPVPTLHTPRRRIGRQGHIFFEGRSWLHTVPLMSIQHEYEEHVETLIRANR